MKEKKLDSRKRQFLKIYIILILRKIYAIMENVNMSEKSGCNQKYKGGNYGKKRNKKNNQNERRVHETSEFWKNN